MSGYESGAVTTVSTSMIPLPQPLWVEGKCSASGTVVNGVAFGLLRHHQKPKYPEAAEGTIWDRESGMYEFVVLTSDGTVTEVHVDRCTVIDRHTGDPYDAFFDGLRYERGIGTESDILKGD